MKISIMLFLISLIVSCTSNPAKRVLINQQELVEDLIKEDKIIGKELPKWISQSGIEKGIVYSVGKIEFDIKLNETYAEEAAMMDAEMKLLSDAPTDVRILAQKSLNEIGLNNSSFYEIQTKLKEVMGVSGIKKDISKVTCRKVIRYNVYETKLNRICWAQVQVPFNNLMEAYKRTIALKYGESKARLFKNKVNQELDHMINNPYTNEAQNERMDNNFKFALEHSNNR